MNTRLCARVSCVTLRTHVHILCVCVIVSALTCAWPEPEAGLAPFQALTGETLQLSLGMAGSGLCQKPLPVPVAPALAAVRELRAPDQPSPSQLHGQRAALSTGEACGGPWHRGDLGERSLAPRQRYMPLPGWGGGSLKLSLMPPGLAETHLPALTLPGNISSTDGL